MPLGNSQVTTKHNFNQNLTLVKRRHFNVLKNNVLLLSLQRPSWRRLNCVMFSHTEQRPFSDVVSTVEKSTLNYGRLLDATRRRNM